MRKARFASASLLLLLLSCSFAAKSPSWPAGAEVPTPVPGGDASAPGTSGASEQRSFVLPQLMLPEGIAVSADGAIWVTAANEAVKLRSDDLGVELRLNSQGSGDGEFNGPFGIVVDASGNVYVAEAGNDRIQKFNSSGEFVTQWGSLGSGEGEFNGPCALSFDSSGNVSVADTFNNRIQKFTTSGGFVTELGAPGLGNGQFQSSNGHRS